MAFRLPRLRLRNPVTPRLRYAPEADGRPDPGEVVWTWVPYEDDPTQGKDRPVLVIGEEGDQLLALQLTSRDHDVDAAQEHRDGREWMDIGTGAWDARAPSERGAAEPAAAPRPGRRTTRGGCSRPRDVFDACSRRPTPYLLGLSPAPCGSGRPRPAGRCRAAGPTG